MVPEQAPGNQRGDQYGEEPTFDVDEMAEDRFSRLAEEPAGGAHQQRPSDGGQRIQHGKAQRGHRRRADQHGAGYTHAVGKARREGGKRRMAVDETANLRRARGEDGPVLEERGAVAPSEPEEELVAGKAARRRDRDHGRGIEVAVMRGERREDQHRLAFQQAAEGEDPVAVSGDKRREAQAALDKVATGARTRSPFTKHAQSEGQKRAGYA